jgi:DNA-directed RNA polymerase I, II, and III subunit RPABC2
MNASSQILDTREAIQASLASERRSRPFLTKYEFNQIIGLRTTHLSKGSPPLVNLDPDFRIKTNMEFRAIALRELMEGRMPYIVERRMPDGKYEYWKLNELSLVAVRHLLRPA